MHNIDRVVFTFCFILFVAVCTALYGFWTNPDNLLPAAANSRNLHIGDGEKHKRTLISWPVACLWEKERIVGVFPGQNQNIGT